MAKLSFYFIVTLLIHFKGAWSKSIVREPRITNGTLERIVSIGFFAFIENHPFQAYLVLLDPNGMRECGGTIVNTYNVITAAHCLEGAQNVMVRIGSTNKLNGGVTYVSNVIHIHPEYDPVTLDYDVGIVEITEGMALDGTRARPIRLVEAGNDPLPEEMLTITGWGATMEGGFSTQGLHVAQVPVVDRTECEETLDSPITDRMICAGYMQGGTDACQGDGGGPAVLASDDLLAGIISFGEGCARPETPGVYTRIGQPEIREFIQSITGS